MNYIDHSQYALFNRCSELWRLKYLEGLRLRPRREQRDDPLALGSLVHSGLEQYYHNRPAKPSSSVIDEVGPTPECLSLAQHMLMHYERVYPREPFDLAVIEKPFERPLVKNTAL